MYPLTNFLDACMFALTVHSQHLGKPLTRTKLVKLLYLTDLRAVDQGVPVRTGVAWTWDRYGPFDAMVLDREDQLVALGVFERHTDRTIYGQPYDTLIVPDGQYRDVTLFAHETDRRFFDIMRDVAVEFADWSTSAVREYTYSTAPMKLAQSDGGQRSCMLDMSLGEHGYRAAARRQDALNRVRALRAKNKGKYRHGVQGDPSELLDEVAAFDHGRRKANEIILGSEGRHTA